jgi:hypothetical protein
MQSAFQKTMKFPTKDLLRELEVSIIQMLFVVLIHIMEGLRTTEESLLRKSFFMDMGTLLNFLLLTHPLIMHGLRKKAFPQMNGLVLSL